MCLIFFDFFSLKKILPVAVKCIIRLQNDCHIKKTKTEKQIDVT